MRIFELIDGILALTGVPFYNDMPEFAENEIPGLFISYSVYDRPGISGDGKETVTKYYVTFNVFGTSADTVDSTYTSLLALLSEYGFVRAGASYTSDNDFPKYYRIAVDYSINIDN